MGTVYMVRSVVILGLETDVDASPPVDKSPGELQEMSRVAKARKVSQVSVRASVRASDIAAAGAVAVAGAAAAAAAAVAVVAPS